jgi:hypothetical protein
MLKFYVKIEELHAAIEEPAAESGKLPLDFKVSSVGSVLTTLIPCQFCLIPGSFIVPNM